MNIVRVITRREVLARYPFTSEQLTRLAASGVLPHVEGDPNTYDAGTVREFMRRCLEKYEASL